MAKERSATLTWQGTGMEFQATLEQGHTFIMHNPPDGNGGSPMDYMLSAVAGCIGMDVLGILQKQRQAVTGLEVHIHGVQAEMPPRVYTQATITFTVRGQGVEPAAVARAIELAQTKYCPANAMFQQAGVAVTTQYVIESSVPTEVTEVTAD